MRKALILIFLSTFLSAYASEYEYIPLVREGVQWTYLCEYMDYYQNDNTHPYVEVMKIRGDEKVNEIAYKQVYSNLNEEPVALIREEDKKVYAKFKQSDYECGMQIYLDYNEQTGEYLIYDFNKLGAGYAERMPWWSLSEGKIEVDGALRKAYYDEKSNSLFFIEGIGILYDYSPFYRPFGCQPDNATIYSLTHVIENGKIVFKTSYYSHYEYFVDHGMSINYGDVNHDQHVNVADVSEYYKGLANGISIDLNGDDTVNVGDVSKLYEIILGR